VRGKRWTERIIVSEMGWKVVQIDWWTRGKFVETTAEIRSWGRGERLE
jgi:hypothetical protein